MEQPGEPDRRVDYIDRRGTDWKIIAVIVGATVLILIALFTWYIGAISTSEERQRAEVQTEEPETEPSQPPVAVSPPPPTQQAPPARREVSITSSTEVERYIRERPVNIYIEREDAGQRESQPTQVIVIPQSEADQYSGDQYQKTQLPASIRNAGSTYYITPGAPVRMDATDLVPTGSTVAGYRTFTDLDASTPADTIYLQIDRERNLYIPYERSVETEGEEGG